jgi:hypothetical protein
MASPNRPGVEVIQELQATPTVTASPTLVPMIVGVCNQIIEALDDEGALNLNALFSGEQYNQASLVVAQSEFPDPRDNIDEINVYEDSIDAFLFFGGQLLSLPRGSHGTFGQSFLKAMNLSRRAAVRSTEANSFAFDGTVGDVLTVAFDVVNPVDTSSDVVINFVGTLTAQEVVDEINSTVGREVASVIDVGGDLYVQIASLISGATSSVTLRQGTSAMTVLFGAGFLDGQEYRVEGAGFRGQDDTDNDLSTPFIEFYQGAYFEGVGGPSALVEVEPFPGAAVPNTVWAGTIDLDDEFFEGKAAQQIFSGPSATIPLVAATSAVPGDQFWADGAQVGDAEIIKLEPSRFKLGKLNTSLSTFDNDGRATTRVYDTVEVNVPIHSNAFAPKNAYFIADGLVWGNILPEGVAASITGSPAGVTTEERPGIIQSSTDIVFPVNLASLTLDYSLTEDGVESDIITFTFVNGPFATIGDLVTDLTGELPGITVGSAGDKLVLSTTKTGADQVISVKSTGTANSALGFSTTAETEDAGKDVEYVILGEITSELISLPLVGEASATLHIIVVDSKGTHDVTASAVDLSTPANLGDLIDAIAVAFGGTAVTDRTLYDGGIPFATISSSGDADPYGTITITTIEGAPTTLISVEATDGTDGFRHLGFYDSVVGEWPEVTGNPIVLPEGGLSAATLTVSWDDTTGPYALTAVLGGPEAAAAPASALAALLNANAALNGISTGPSAVREVWYIGDDAAGAITIRSVRGGSTVNLDVDASGGSAGLLLGFVEASNDTDTGVDSLTNADGAGNDTLKGTTLGFWLDDNPFEYEATFTTNSLQDAIDEVNEAVGGDVDVASEETAGVMTITSLLKGAASMVEINDSSSAATELGLSGSAEGSGRPDPDFYVSLLGAAVIGPSILRNGTTGQPFSLESAKADVYLQYSGLRLDVTASADDANILTFTSVELMEDSIGPISVANPLALGVFLAQQNAPTVDISALGLDEQNDAAPEGTIDAWARALELLESKEVYGLAPLTGDSFINQLVSTHVQALSQPTNRGERIALIWQPVPDHAPDTSVSSGADAETNGTDNSVTLETNPSTDLVQAGIDISGTIPVSDNLYLEVLIVDAGSTSLRRYSVEEVNGVLLNLRVTFAERENDEGFYSTTPIDGSSGLTGIDWALRIRGDELLVPGTTRTDLNAVAEAAASQGEAYASRRVYLLFCDSLDTSVNGIVQKVPGYYGSAAISGMIAQQNPSQPFTRLGMTGFSRVYGTDDTFSENQMDTIADGGRYVLVNQGGAVSSRHQRSTSVTSIEERELSITKAIDWLAKGLRDTNRVFIGRYVITQGFLDQLTMANEGFLQFAVQLGVVRKAALQDILQDAENPDTILINVEAQPLYPANKIRVTIVA